MQMKENFKQPIGLTQAEVEQRIKEGRLTELLMIKLRLPGK